MLGNGMLFLNALGAILAFILGAASCRCVKPVLAKCLIPTAPNPLPTRESASDVARSFPISGRI
ncbi:hypothetical protein [Rhizobacter sp. OV335]|uniref:hypothetical protein n=1 Tax=Rhizobacter sp. OV335 TaxID=1500264 RepID=UPI001F2E8CD6|nr:hypothetical protein [Rhizobacter sp. OV335]